MQKLPVLMLGGLSNSPVTGLGHGSLPVNFWQQFSPGFIAG